MSKSSKTTATSNQTVTATPNNPEWVTSGVSGLQDRITGLLNTDARSMVPGQSALQTRAFDQAGTIGGWRSGNEAAQGAATGLIGSTMTPTQARSGSLLDADLEAYQNPYLDQVVSTTLTGFDETAGMNRARMAGAQARGGKFSGSGSAIERMLFERGSGQDRAGIEAGLRSAGFDRATGLATADIDRAARTSEFNAGTANQMALADREAQLRAAGLLGDLSNAGAVNDRADLGLLTDMGGQQRQIERERLGADANLLTLISQLQGNQPYDLFRGQTTVGNANSTSKTKESDPMGAVGGLLSGAGSLLGGLGAMGATLGPLAVLSDKRLKEDIRTEGKDGSGRRVVSYRYKGEPESVRRIGHIAQEVEKTDPHAIRRVGKYRAIDYGLLGEVA